MMNRILIAVNVLLVAAVAFLFFRVWKLETPAKPEEPEAATEEVKPVEEKRTSEPGRAPTGKIAFVNIDRLNEESLEIVDLIAESRRRKNSIESSVEALSSEYQKKVEEFQMSQKAGI